MNFSVSIIVATFGDRSWIEKSLRASASAAGQGAAELVALHLSDGTLAEARNCGALAARGDWLVFLDADDELAPGYVEALQRVYENLGWDGAGICGLLVPAVSYRYEGAATVTITPPAIPQKGRWPELNECVIGTAIERGLFEAVGGFRDLPALEDYDLFLRCYDAGAPLVYAPDAVYKANVNPDGRNRDQSPYAQIWADHLERVSA